MKTAIQRIKETDFIKLKIQDVTVEPKDGFYYVMCNRYWIVQDECVLFYRSFISPQCNSQRSVLENSYLVKQEKAEIIYINRAYVPHSCSDYI